LGQRIPTSPNDLSKGLTDTQAHVDVLSHEGTHTYSLQAVRIDAQQRAQHVRAERICERGQALHGIQKHVRVVVLNRLKEYVADGGLERAHRLVGCGSRAEAHQFAQEEQAVGADGEQGILEELERSLVGRTYAGFLWLTGWSRGDRRGGRNTNREHHARFSGKQADRLGGYLDETLDVLENLFKNRS
jgi:hypothetical protein